MEIRPTLAFESRLEDEANRIASGEIQVIIPFQYGLHKGFNIFLLFPNLLPCPKLFSGTITAVSVGSQAKLKADALRENKDVYVVLDAGTRDCVAMAISWNVAQIPMSQEEVVNVAYRTGNLPEPE